MDNPDPTSPSSTLSDSEVATVFRRLRDLKKALRPHVDSNLLAIEMIKAIIGEGWDTGPRIIGTMKQLGFDAKHAGATLGKNRGNNPKLHYWLREEDGRYVAHDDPMP